MCVIIIIIIVMKTGMFVCSAGEREREVKTRYMVITWLLCCQMEIFCLYKASAGDRERSEN
jgi:hypothetical protein